VWWTYSIEPYEEQNGVYDEAFLTLLAERISMAESFDLYPFIALRVSYYKDKYLPWCGWSNKYGGDLVNMNDEGRQRFVNCWSMLAERFPDIGVIPWFFSYHAEEFDELREQTYYEITLPAMLKAIREHNNAPLIFNPIHQGFKGSWQNGVGSGQYLSPYLKPTDYENVYYNTNSHDGEPMFSVLCRGEEWNYNYNFLTEFWKPALDFKREYGINLICVENLAFIGPYTESRMALARAIYELQKSNDISWFCWDYGDYLFNSDGSLNPSGELLKEYS